MTDQSVSVISSDQEGIRSLLVRLKAQPLQVGFQVQYEMPLSLVLKTYAENLFTVPQMILAKVVA